MSKDYKATWPSVQLQSITVSNCLSVT